MTTDSIANAAVRRRGNEGALFTSSKCPPGPGLENSCELPFGFVWTPMSPSDSHVATVECSGEALPPVICLTCLSYFNQYALVDLETGIWKCPLCLQQNVAPKEEFKEGGRLSSILTSSIVEYHQKVGPSNSSIEDTSTYVLVVDGNLSGNEAKEIVTAMQQFFKDFFAQQQQSQSSQKVNLGLIVFDKAISMYQLGLSGVASADIYTTEEANDDNTLIKRKNTMQHRSYLLPVEPGDDLSSLWRCLSAVFGVSVQTPSSSNGQNPDATDLTPPDDKGPPSRKEMLRRRKEARLRKEKLENDEKSKNGNNGPPAVKIESPWVTSRRRTAGTHGLRCTGEAIQCAIDLTGVGVPHPSRTSRILLFTNGCPNLGDGSVVGTDETELSPSGRSNGSRSTPDVVDPAMLAKAVQYFDVTANYALENGIGIDVFCTGSNELGIPAYQALAEPSGGYVLPHLSFTTPHIKRNLNFILQQTYISRTKETEVGHGIASSECIVDLRVDGFVTPSQLVGPGEILPVNGAGLLESERAAFAVGASLAANHGYRTNNLPSTDMVEMSTTRMKLGRVDPITTLSVMLLVNERFHSDDKFAFFQFTSRHVSNDGKILCTRVSTHRLPVAKNVNDFLDCIDEEVVAVVLAKGAVYRSIHGREETDDSRVLPTAGDNDLMEKLAYEAQLDLDATIQRISGKFRLLGLERMTRSNDLTEEGGVMASQSSLDFAFPPKLADALRRLYHLRRGSLLSPGPMLSKDDRAQTRALFLRLPMEDCSCMMAPSVWSSGKVDQSPGSMDAVPADTLALWDNCIIAVDHHDNLFVWSGRNSKSPEYDEIRQRFKEFLLERSSYRLPMPEFHFLSEGDSMSRRIVARLAPSHADPPDHQIAHFPALESLAAEELEALRMKFRFYDASSDASFRTWFWNVSRATNASRTAGSSLCE